MKDETQRVNLFLNPKIVERAKIQAIKDDMSLSKFIDEAVEYYLKHRNKNAAVAEATKEAAEFLKK